MMSLTADHNSNRLLGQGNYDGGGNFLGNSQYSYDILNRLSATGQSSYTYSPGDNKRMAVYSSSGTSATAWFNIYDPNGRKLGVYSYTATAPWSRAQFQPGLSKDIWYLGSKRVDMSEDQVGSNWDQTQYYPWGQFEVGQPPSETQGFGTYVLDTGSGLYYADQRYYNQNWGRFLTADPSNANIKYAASTSWNRYAYTDGDPINKNDKSGRCANIINGVNQDNQNSPATEQYANEVGAATTYPYAGLGFWPSIGSVATQSFGFANNSTAVAAYGQNIAVSTSQSGTVTLYLFSGGAQAANTAWQNGLIDQSKIDYVVYVSPGFGPGQGGNILEGTQGTYWIANPFSIKDSLANQSYSLPALFDSSISYGMTFCDHDFACVATSQQFGGLFNSLNGDPCDASLASPPDGGGDPDPDPIDPDDPREDNGL